MKKQLQARLAKLKAWRENHEWADPHSPSYSNGYDSAVDNEIEFLESLLKVDANKPQ